jgi:hypothetical protein
MDDGQLAAALKATEGDFCQARSKLWNPVVNRESYFICTNDAGHDADAGHPDARHTACDGEGHVVARWRSETSPIEIWTPAGAVWV